MSEDSHLDRERTVVPDGVPRSLDSAPTYGRGETPADLRESELPEDIIEEQRGIVLDPGHVIGGRFEVIDRLGFGGMGAVYKVADRVMDGQVKALKVMLPSLLHSESLKKRFVAEVQVSQQLAHPNIINVYDIGHEGGLQFFTMEYIEGKTLHRHLKEKGGTLPVGEAVEIADQVCAGLDEAHRSTIHRDLKPQNIMVQPDGSIKILDFGLAKLMSPGRMTRSSMALGTAYYQAPEQTMSVGEIDVRADIYSLGVVLYEMLTGQLPTGRFEAASELNRSVRKRVDVAIDRMLDRKPEARPETVADVRRLLRSAGGKKRGKGSLLAAGLVAVLLIAGTFAFNGLRPSIFPPPVPPEPVIEEHVPAPEPEPEIEPPPVTVTDVVEAKLAMAEAETAAAGADGENLAAKTWSDAVKAKTRADEFDTRGALAEAKEAYHEARGMFESAKTEAERAASELAALDTAKTAMDKARSEAEKNKAAEHAATRWRQALDEEQNADGLAADGERVAAAKAYETAETYYSGAAKEAGVELARIAEEERKAEEKRRAELARLAAEKKPYEPEMVSIRGGTFRMGSPSSESGHDDDESPVHDVTVGDFYMGKYEVTVGQFRAFVDATGYKTDAEKGDGAYVYSDGEWGKKSDASWRNPYYSQADTHPVACISWNDATAYCRWLSEQTGKKYRLPTEAEWEYACRAGTTTARYWGDSDSRMHEYANGADQSAKRTWDTPWTTMPGDDGYSYTAPAGSYKPNVWGLYDMMGNVWEWCSDWYDEDYYSKSPRNDPQGPSSGERRVLRGGSWFIPPEILRSAFRGWGSPVISYNYNGFRVCHSGPAG